MTALQYTILHSEYVAHGPCDHVIVPLGYLPLAATQVASSRLREIDLISNHLDVYNGQHVMLR